MNTASQKPRPAGPPIGLFLLLIGVFGAFAAAWFFLQPQPALTIDDAVQALADGDIETAYSIISAEYERDPADPALQQLLAVTENMRGNTERAVDLLEGLPDFAENPDLQRQAGQFALQQHQLSTAEKRLRRAVELDSLNVESHRLLVELYSNLLRTNDARKHLRAIDRLGAASVADTLTACIGDRARFDLLENVTQLEQAFENEPQNAFVLHTLVNNFLSADRTDAATELLTNHPPESVQPAWRHHLASAERHLVEKNYHAALTALQACESSADGLSRGWLAWGRALRGVDRPQEAAVCFQNASLLDEFDPEPVFLLSQLLQTQDPAESARLIERTKKLQATSVLIESVLTKETFAAVAERIPNIVGHLIDIGATRPALLCCRWMEQEGYRFEALAKHQQYLADHEEEIPDELFAGVDLLPLSTRFEQSAAVNHTTDTHTHGEIRLTDVSADAGIRFSYDSFEDDGFRVLTFVGGGVGAFDYDADGQVDFYFPQGGPLPHQDRTQVTTDGLFRQIGPLAFAHVSQPAGIPPAAFGHGVAIADANNDGFDDIAVTRFGANSLFVNNGDGTFSDLSAALDSQPAWSTSAAFADLNQDGFLDLYIANYLDVESKKMIPYADETDATEGPASLPPAPDELLLNRGDGTFQNHSESSGIQSASGNGLGVIISDFNNDGLPDIFTGNDQTANLLFLGKPDSNTSFQESALSLGVAYGGDGRAEGCMGIACGDINNDGLPELFVTNFAQETNTLYLNTKRGGFLDNTKQAGLERVSYSPMGWGAQFVDLNGDATLDLAIASGHLHEQKMTPFVFRGNATGTFQNVSSTAGRFFQQPHCGRGLAVADLNNDATPDLVFTERQGSPTLLRNESSQRRVCVRLVGRQSNRSAIGARFSYSAGSRTVTHELVGGSGYLSENQRLVFCSTPDESYLRAVSVTWPSGRRDSLNQIPLPESNRLTIIESSATQACRVIAVP